MTIAHNPHLCPLCGLRWISAPESAPVSLVKANVGQTTGNGQGQSFVLLSEGVTV